MPSKTVKHFGHVIAWLAAEYKYLRILHQSIERIQLEKIRDTELLFKRDKRVIRYIGRAEAKIEEDIPDILKTLREAKIDDLMDESGSGALHPNLHKLFEQIEVPAAELLRDGSMYVGSLQDWLKSIRTGVAVQNRYPSENKRELILRGIGNFKREVSDLEKWVASLDAALGLLKKYYDQFGSYLPGINGKLSKLNTTKKFRFCSRKELIKILSSGKLEDREFFEFENGLTDLLIKFRARPQGTIFRCTCMMMISGGVDQHNYLMALLKGKGFKSDILCTPDFPEYFASRGKKVDTHFFHSFQKYAIENLKRVTRTFQHGFYRSEAKRKVELALNAREQKVLYDALKDPDYLAKNLKKFQLFMTSTIKLANVDDGVAPISQYGDPNEKHVEGYEVLLVLSSETPTNSGPYIYPTTTACDANKYLLGIVVLTPLGNLEREIVKLVRASNVKVPVLNVRRKVIWPKK